MEERKKPREQRILSVVHVTCHAGEAQPDRFGEEVGHPQRLRQHNADSGDRRVLSGTWPGRFDWEEYGAGPFLDEVQNLAQRADGELYAWTRTTGGTGSLTAWSLTIGSRWD